MEPKTFLLADTFNDFFVETGAIPETPNHKEFLAEKVDHNNQLCDPRDKSEWACRTGRDGAE
jgi:hypothetical protein